MKNNLLLSARLKAGLTQEQLAKLAGIDRTTYTHIERGVRNPSLKAAFGISKALNKNVEDIFLNNKVLLKHNNETEKHKSIN